MKAEINLYVHAVFPDGQIVEVGRLLVRNLLSFQDQEGFFRYAPSFLDHPLAYAIDPIHFPLSTQTFPAKRKTAGIHHLFDDSLPDAWGRHILARKGNLEQQRFTPICLPFYRAVVWAAFSTARSGPNSSFRTTLLILKILFRLLMRRVNLKTVLMLQQWNCNTCWPAAVPPEGRDQRC
jgi:hypothetical protein